MDSAMYELLLDWKRLLQDARMALAFGKPEKTSELLREAIKQITLTLKETETDG